MVKEVKGEGEAVVGEEGGKTRGGEEAMEGEAVVEGRWSLLERTVQAEEEVGEEVMEVHHNSLARRAGWTEDSSWSPSSACTRIQRPLRSRQLRKVPSACGRPARDRKLLLEVKMQRSSASV